MDFEPLNNDTKARIDVSDGTYKYSTMSQLAKIDRTRKILLLLIFMEFVLSTISVIVVIYSYALDFTLGFESYNVVFRFLPFLSFLCFGFGLIAADRYHVTGLRLGYIIRLAFKLSNLLNANKYLENKKMII
ncbi:unnamed protein product [Rotaria magnacalcarata]|uniref:Uncharacterized protein n=1 Tax=Rotaria magnacalcarata TaxID=392030 RepID=A0A818Y1A2_9BILA|nr:unnamed protein product [Rotaria magnacalcarata]CAF4043533.1 unnamed protein product [Rotaria magnacalcarata]CAF4065931.1 unnamed protein product [Rotaria magnacalcarata]CAF4114716.1 unnamed protein product [Rotaria magnacalcarata]CAF5068668.1 unnamed protein product [Rotaria magnacalcarata]